MGKVRGKIPGTHGGGRNHVIYKIFDLSAFNPSLELRLWNSSSCDPFSKLGRLGVKGVNIFSSNIESSQVLQDTYKDWVGVYASLTD